MKTPTALRPPRDRNGGREIEAPNAYNIFPETLTQVPGGPEVGPEHEEPTGPCTTSVHISGRGKRSDQEPLAPTGDVGRTISVETLTDSFPHRTGVPNSFVYLEVVESRSRLGV